MIFSIAFFPFKMLPKLVRYLIRRVKRSYAPSREIHLISLRHKEGWLRLAIALALAAFISWQLLRYDLKTGILFSLSSCLAIYSGMIYKSRVAIFLVLIGAIMGALAFTVVPRLVLWWGGDWIVLGVYVLIMLSIWLWSVWLKRVKVPKEWKEEQAQKRTPRKTPEQTPEKAPVETTTKTPVEQTRQASAESPAKTTASTPAKTPAKTIEKVPESISQKTTARTTRQTPTKTRGKTTRKTSAKTTKSETKRT